MSNINVFKEALKDIESGKKLAISTIIKIRGTTPRGEGTKMVVLEDGSFYGTIGGGSIEKDVINASLEAIGENRSCTKKFDLGEGDKARCNSEVEVFIDVYNPKPKLLIVGGGHVGLALYKAASLLDFNIVVFEDRKDFLDENRFPLASELIFGNFEDRLKEYPIDENCYIAIVTRGQELGKSSLKAVLESRAKYIGFLGSKKKIINLKEELTSEGYDNNMDKLYTPIGLNIKGESPEEIAICILSEILYVKNGGSLTHMRDTI